MPDLTDYTPTCWCGKGRHEAEIQCTQCEKYMHYECLGLSVLQISSLINQEPGPYLCKICSSQTSKRDVNNIKKSPENTLIEFDQGAFDAVYHGSYTKTVMEAVNKIESKVNNLEANLLSSVVDLSTNVQGKFKSFADVVKKDGLTNKQDVSESRSLALYQADPKKSIIVSHLSDPQRFGSPSAIKHEITNSRPDAVFLVSFARMLNSGNLMIEAQSFDGRDSLLTGWPEGFFGDRAKIFTIDRGPQKELNGQWLVIPRFQKGSDIQDLERELKSEYPSLSSIEKLPELDNRSCVTLRLFIADSNECDRAMRFGIFYEFCHYRVVQSARRPLRCYNCQRFGRVAAACKYEKRCANCGSTEANHPSPGLNTPKCRNCDGDHHARSISCPHFVEHFQRAKLSLRDGH